MGAAGFGVADVCGAIVAVVAGDRHVVCDARAHARRANIAGSTGICIVATDCVGQVDAAFCFVATVVGAQVFVIAIGDFSGRALANCAQTLANARVAETTRLQIRRLRVHAALDAVADVVCACDVVGTACNV